MIDPREQFRAAIAVAGLTPPDSIEADGKLHRFPSNGKRGDDAGWYVLHVDGLPAGAFGCWRTGAYQSWHADVGRPLTSEERAHLAQKAEADRKALEEQAHRQSKARAEAERMWRSAALTPDEHSYLLAKSVRGHRIRISDRGQLLIPMRDAHGTMHSLQLISEDGEKRFLPGGRVAGCYFAIGKLKRRLYIAEGYATGASIYEATGQAVVVAFCAGNLSPVGRAQREKHPDLELVFCADDDHTTPGNPGLTKALAAARAVGGLVAVPNFGTDRPDGASDFNDLARIAGLEAVKRDVDGAQRPDNAPTTLTADPLRAIGADIALASDAAPKEGSPSALRVRELARLSAIDYDRARKAEAKALGVSVTALDADVKKARADFARTSGDDRAIDFESVEPWPDVVLGGALLDNVAATIRRFVVLSTAQEQAAALWVAFTWFIDHVEIAPILAVSSPEKRCGKTTLLEVLKALVARPLACSNVSPSALFRTIERYGPTLLIDEGDAFLRESEELRCILDSGHTRAAAYVIRTVGEDFEPMRFSTWGAKAICLIGRLRDTLGDRSIQIGLRRRLPGERREKVRHADPTLFSDLRRRLARFAQDTASSVAKARPRVPEGLHDRAADNWEPLLAIADETGNPWSELARKAAQVLSASAAPESESLGVHLLSDVREIFERTGVERLASKELVRQLTEDETKPWAELNQGRPITERRLCSMLGKFGVPSAKPMRLPDGTNRRGYAFEWFEDPFSRYLPESSPSNASQRHEQGSMRAVTDSGPVTVDNASRIAIRSQASTGAGCDGVTDAGSRWGTGSHGGNGSADANDPER